MKREEAAQLAFALVAFILLAAIWMKSDETADLARQARTPQARARFSTVDGNREISLEVYRLDSEAADTFSVRAEFEWREHLKAVGVR